MLTNALIVKNNLIVTAVFFSIVHSASLNAEVFKAHCRDYPPELSFVDGDCVGVVPDLMKDIVNELGHEIVWKKVPWIRSIKEAKNGSVDILIRHSMTAEREAFLDATPYAYYTRELSFYKSPSFTSDINSYSDLKKLKVGVIRGNFYSPKLSTIDTRLLTEVDTTQQLLGMLERGRIDLAVTSSSHNEKLFAERFEKSTFVDTFFNPLYISIAKNSNASQYYDDIAKLLLEYRKSERINQYFENYGLPVPYQVFE